MSGESTVAVFLFIVCSGSLERCAASKEAVGEVPAQNSEGSVQRARRGEGGAGAPPEFFHTPDAGPGTTELPSLVPDRRAGQSEEWIESLRSSLMRNNYDYPESETLPPKAQPNDDTTSEISDQTKESSGDSGTNENGRPSTEEHDNPTPRSQHNSPKPERSFRRALPNVDPMPSLAYQNRRSNWKSVLGLEIPRSTRSTHSTRGTRGSTTTRPYVRNYLDPMVITMPPRTAENAALIDEINEEFDAKRRHFLESLYELEDQLKPMYPHGKDPLADPRLVDRRGSLPNGFRSSDAGNGIKPQSLPFVGPDGVQRYRVYSKAMGEFLPMDKYTFLRNSFPDANLDAELIPENPEDRNQGREIEHREPHKTRYSYAKSTSKDAEDRMRPTSRRPTQREDRFKHRPVRTKGDHKRHKKKRSMYLESADLHAFIPQYNSRRDAESLEGTTDLPDGCSSLNGSSTALTT